MRNRNGEGRLHIQNLERRRLLSAAIVGGVLKVAGTVGADAIRVSLHPSYINLLNVSINGSTQSFLLGDYTRIDVNAYGGADTIQIDDLGAGHPSRLQINAGDGNDSITGSPNSERVDGGAGNDTVNAGGGDDYVAGGAGDDSINGEGGNDTLRGNDGKDTIEGGRHANLLIGDAGDDLLVDFYNFATMFGGDGNDTLRFINRSGRYAGGVGYGEDGNDVLVGHNIEGAGYLTTTPALYGGPGNDTLSGTKLDGGDGDDRLTLFYGIANSGHGGAGNDTVTGALGGTIDGGDGDDVINLDGIGDASQTVRGGDGDDEITAVAAILYGDAGDDVLRGSGQSHGGAGNDRLIQLAPTYYSPNGHGLFGDEGNDLLIGNAGEDLLDGGTGDDTLFGGAANDTLRGGNNADLLYGEDGFDQLFGDSGNDLLYGGNADDVLHGGKHDDRLYGGGDAKDKNRTDDGRDTGYGDDGSDWFDPDHKWAVKEQDGPKATRGEIVSPDFAAGGSALVGDAARIITNPGWPVTQFPTSGNMKSDWSGAAAIAGVYDATPSVDALADTSPPRLAAVERRAVAPSILRVPADWILTKLVSTESGLVWFRVRTHTAEYVRATVSLPLSQVNQLGWVTRGLASITQIGVHPASVLVFNALTVSESVPLPDDVGTSATSLSTPAGARVLLAGQPAIDLTTAEPGFAPPALAPASTRALWLLQGVVYLDDVGPRFVPRS